MTKQQRSENEMEIAKLRDAILLSCLSDDLEGARNNLLEARKVADKMRLSDDERREVNCRFLESELDIAEREKQPIISLVQVLKQILASEDFSDNRKSEILCRGLSRIEDKGY